MLLMANALIPALLVGTTAILLVTSPSYAFSVAKGGAQGAKGARSQPSRRPRKATPAKNALPGKRAPKTQEASAPREGSKTAQVVAMLQRKNGVTLAEIMDKMGWQKHTVRGRRNARRSAPEGGDAHPREPTAYCHRRFRTCVSCNIMQQKPCNRSRVPVGR